MFSRKEQLIKRTGEFGVGRYEFLRQLIHEFNTTTSLDNKRQTLANLANFAYDPINYEFMKQLHLTDLFLAEIQSDNEDFVYYALSGLCNLSCDPEIKEYIVSLNGIRLVSDLLLHQNVEIAVNAITTLYYLYDGFVGEISEELKGKVAEYVGSGDPRLRNLGDKVVVSKTVTSEDVDGFSKLSGDTNPIHSAGSGRKVIVHGAYLNSLISGVIGTKMPGPGAIVARQTLFFPNKCYVGDKVDITVKMVENRKVIKVGYKCEVEGKVVLFGEAKLVMDKSLKC